MRARDISASRLDGGGRARPSELPALSIAVGIGSSTLTRPVRSGAICLCSGFVTDWTGPARKRNSNLLGE